MSFFHDVRTGRAANRLADLRSSSSKPSLSFLARSAFLGLFPKAEETPFAEVTADFAQALELAEHGNDPLLRASSPENATCLLRRALEETLARCLDSATRVAVLTGGGLDSGGLLALVAQWARQHHERSYLAVAMDFNTFGDDRPYLESLQQRLGCSVVRVTPEDGARFSFVLGCGVDCAPIPWPTAAMEFAAYTRARQEGADCIVTGVGGDGLLNGEGRSLAGLARERGLGSALRSARRLRGFHRPRSPAWTWVIRPLVAESVPVALRARYARTTPLAIPTWAGPVAKDVFRSERRERRHELRQALIGATPLPNNYDRVFARYRQQFSIATGISRVDPFLDITLQRTLRGVPRHWLLAGDVRRGLFREALRDVIPDSLYRRRDKATFERPLVRYVNAGGGFEALRGLADVSTLADLGIVQPRRFRKAFDQLVAEPMVGPNWTHVWPMLALEGFARAHFRT